MDANEFIRWADSQNEKGKKRIPEPENNAIIPDPDHPLVSGALRMRLKELSSMAKNSGRNDALNKAALYLGRLPIDRSDLRKQLLTACVENGLLSEDGENQCNATISSGFKKADLEGPRKIEDIKHTVEEINEIGRGVKNERTEETETEKEKTLEEIENGFWESRESLNLIYRCSLSRMVSPWAVLGCCAARVLCLIPPTVTLPDLVGTRGSLNLYVALSAKSGGGKGTAMGVAANLIPGEIRTLGIGSGEGMVEALKNSTDDDSNWPAVLFSVDEIDTLAAMGSRRGGTTSVILRQGFSGESLGFSYRGRTSLIQAHTYRMCVLLSVQPARAGALLDDAGGGTPQRFLWLPARDRRITSPPPYEWPVDPTGRLRHIPSLSHIDIRRAVGTVSVPDVLIRTVRDERAAAMRDDDDALDGHAIYAREKISYALAVMDGRTSVSEDDWTLAGTVAAVSDRCRDHTARGWQEAQEDEARRKGRLRGVGNDEAEAAKTASRSDRIARIARWAERTLRKHGPMTAGALRRKAKYGDRMDLGVALLAAASAGKVESDDGVWRAI
jgi:Protein of unknown function (DUF3987)